VCAQDLPDRNSRPSNGASLPLTQTRSPSLQSERGTLLRLRGLALYRGVLDDVNAANHAASIAFSSLTAMFAFGLYRPDEKAVEVVDDFCRISC